MSDRQRAKRIEELFRLGVEVGVEGREDFLLRHCGDDQPLWQELSELLAQDDQGTKDYLNSPVLSTWRRGDTSRAAENGSAREVVVGTRTERIGHYRVIEKLGEGGMGSVYLARQEEPVVREVALKIVKLGMDTRRVVARFDRERQALALMDHPGIARIYDGGATDNGRPYFVMEYVPGLPITEYCDRRRLGVRERLKLFARVCDAVHHAHGKGIVHRDIKPTNVLVTERDDLPVPKVIDFGISLATRRRQDPRQTEAHEVIGTYAYMSPEQADPSVEVDARSDVYSLGVLLYELLAGVLPFDQEALKDKSPSEVSKLLRDTDPPSPSTKLARLGHTSTSLAARRGMDGRTLVRRLSGDLDWITLRAMERVRDRRYPTAALLATDVRRHLQSRVVLAGPPSMGYRVAKYVRRHRVGVGATAAVVVALGLGTAGVALGFDRATEEASVAAGLRETLQEEWLALADDFDPRLGEPTPDDSLRSLADKVDSTFRGNPLGEAEARLRLATGFHSEGDLAEALEQIREAKALQLAHGAPLEDIYATSFFHYRLVIDRDGYVDPDAGQEASEVGLEVLSKRSKTLGEAAAVLLTHALDRREDVLGADLDGLRGELNALDADDPARGVAADLLEIAGAFLGHHLALGAEPLLGASLDLRRATLGSADPETVRGLALLVTHLHRAGQSSKAQTEVEATQARVEEHYEAGHWVTAEVESLLGECLSRRGDAAGGEALLTRSHAALLADRGQRARPTVHAAIRLLEHYQRVQGGNPPLELVGALESPFAKAVRNERVWHRTAEALGFEARYVDALAELMRVAETESGMQSAEPALRTLLELAGRSEPVDRMLLSLLADLETRVAETSPLGEQLADAVVTLREDGLAKSVEPWAPTQSQPNLLPQAPEVVSAPVVATAEPAPEEQGFFLPDEFATAEELEEALREVLESEDVDPGVSLTLGWIACCWGPDEVELYELAEQVIQKAMEDGAAGEDLGTTLALNLNRQQQVEGAVNVMNQLSALASNGSLSVETLAVQALMLENLGLVAEAGQTLDQAYEKLDQGSWTAPWTQNLLNEVEGALGGPVGGGANSLPPSGANGGPTGAHGGPAGSNGGSLTAANLGGISGSNVGSSAGSNQGSGSAGGTNLGPWAQQNGFHPANGAQENGAHQAPDAGNGASPWTGSNGASIFGANSQGLLRPPANG